MNEQVSPDPVSLEDLKRAIEAVGTRPFTDGDYFTTSRLCSWEGRRADAWRAAFEWNVGLDARFATGPGSIRELEAEYEEGMALIREKLQS